MLSLKNVTKKYGDITAVNDVSFEVADGEFVFITGPSGSGKSTVIKLILRQIKPDSGKVIFDEKDIGGAKQSEIPKLRQQMGVIFQDFKMIPERTLRENIEIALAVTNVSPKDWKDRVAHVIKLVGLDKKDNFFPSQLAGGELQRGSLARALVTNPTLILADEPTGNLDWDTAEEMMNLFEKINKEGKTIVMATHHLGIIDKHKKRVIKLEGGKMASDTGKKKEDKKEEAKAENESDAEGSDKG